MGRRKEQQRSEGKKKKRSPTEPSSRVLPPSSHRPFTSRNLLFLPAEYCLLLEPNTTLPRLDALERDGQQPREGVEDDKGQDADDERGWLGALEQERDEQVWSGDRPDCEIV